MGGGWVGQRGATELLVDCSCPRTVPGIVRAQRVLAGQRPPLNGGGITCILFAHPGDGIVKAILLLVGMLGNGWDDIIREDGKYEGEPVVDQRDTTNSHGVPAQDEPVAEDSHHVTSVSCTAKPLRKEMAGKTS